MDNQELRFVWNHETGMFEEYDDAYDLTIHCTSAEDSDRVANLFIIASQIAPNGLWTPAKKLPPLHHVVEDDDEEPLEYESSEKLLVYTENGRIVANVRYVKSENFVGWDDWSGGLFNTKVTHWMPQPKPPMMEAE